MFRRTAAAALALVLGLTGVASAAETLPAAAAQADVKAEAKADAKGVQVILGKLEKDVFYMSMLPKVVVVKAGESVTWVNKSGFDVHTVTFLAGKDMSTLTEADFAAVTAESGSTYSGGYLSSGIFGDGGTYTLTFDKPGTYEYLCLLHPQMVGTVVVLPADSAISTVAQRQAEADAANAEAERTAKLAEAAYKSKGAKVALNGDGTKTFTVQLGAGSDTEMLLQFAPSSLRIAEGDTVKFVTGGHAYSHSVGVNVPAGFKVFNPDMSPIMENMAPQGGPFFDGTGTVLSGMMAPPAMAGFNPPGTPSEFQLTFTKAGTYKVVDYVLQGFGIPVEMTVTVVQKGTVDVVINGELLKVDYRGAHFHDGTVYVPFRAVADMIGATVSYDAATNTADAFLGLEAPAKQGVSQVYVNGQAVLGVHQHDGRFYMPAHLFASFMSGKAEWDAAAGLMTLTIPTFDPAVSDMVDLPAHNH